MPKWSKDVTLEDVKGYRHRDCEDCGDSVIVPLYAKYCPLCRARNDRWQELACFETGKLSERSVKL